MAEGLWQPEAVKSLARMARPSQTVRVFALQLALATCFALVLLGLLVWLRSAFGVEDVSTRTSRGMSIMALGWSFFLGFILGAQRLRSCPSSVRLVRAFTSVLMLAVLILAAVVVNAALGFPMEDYLRGPFLDRLGITQFSIYVMLIGAFTGSMLSVGIEDERIAS